MSIWCHLEEKQPAQSAGGGCSIYLSRPCAILFSGIAGYERQRTNLEKMGFVMGGGGASGPAEQTARNTKASLDFLRQIAENSKLKTTPNLANATVARLFPLPP